ncbi:MAG: VOC family protein [Oscillospiraceae bacterium]|nr:VOC family protein [Oscillospiraceae bacterium]
MLIPTIHFPGNCEEAIAYYKETVGAEVKQIVYFRDAPSDSGIDLPPNFVTYSDLLIYGTPISMTDGAETQITCENFTLTVFLHSAEEVTSVFNKLADGGQVIEALAPQFWTSLSGDVKDRFGLNWTICASDALE